METNDVKKEPKGSSTSRKHGHAKADADAEVTPSAPSASSSFDDGQASAALTAVGLPVKSPPTVTLPPLPNGYVSGGVDLRGLRPTHAEIAMIPDAITELKNFSGYSGMFGVTAPPAMQVADSLLIASQWAELLVQVSEFESYVRTQEAMAWKDAMNLISRLKPPFQIARSADSSLAGKYPAIARLLDVWKTIAKRGASTRAKAKKETAQKNAKIAAQVAASQAEPSAAPQGSQPAAGTSAAPQAPRIVTVQG